MFLVKALIFGLLRVMSEKCTNIYMSNIFIVKRVNSSVCVTRPSLLLSHAITIEIGALEACDVKLLE